MNLNLKYVRQLAMVTVNGGLGNLLTCGRLSPDEISKLEVKAKAVHSDLAGALGVFSGTFSLEGDEIIMYQTDGPRVRKFVWKFNNMISSNISKAEAAEFEKEKANAEDRKSRSK